MKRARFPTALCLCSLQIAICFPNIESAEAEGIGAPADQSSSRNVPIPTSERDPAKRNSLSKFRDISDFATKLLQAEKKAESLDEKIQTAIRLVAFADQITIDTRYPSSSTLQRTRRRLTARLRGIKNRTLAAQHRQQERPERIEIKPEVLAQLNQAVNGGAPNANNNLAAADYGPMLVELIQRTISPNSWDINGGASTIQYWRPGMALVVRAPQDLHEELPPLLRQLRVQ